MDLNNYASLLNEEPPEDKIKAKNGVRYLPISFIENKLDEIFGAACWSYEMTGVQMIVNEVTCVVNLKVWHPLLKDWVIRSGTAAVPIQQDAGALITDIGAKKKNALEKNIPTVKSIALKNAAQSLGKIFGRDLARKQDQISNYEPTNSLPNAMFLIGSCESIEDLTAIKAEVNMKNPTLKALAIKKHKELSKNTLQIEEGNND